MIAHRERQHAPMPPREGGGAHHEYSAHQDPPALGYEETAGRPLSSAPASLEARLRELQRVVDAERSRIFELEQDREEELLAEEMPAEPTSPHLAPATDTGGAAAAEEEPSERPSSAASPMQSAPREGGSCDFVRTSLDEFTLLEHECGCAKQVASSAQPLEDPSQLAASFGGGALGGGSGQPSGASSPRSSVASLTSWSQDKLNSILTYINEAESHAAIQQTASPAPGVATAARASADDDRAGRLLSPEEGRAESALSFADAVTPLGESKYASRASQLANTVYAGVKQKMTGMKAELQAAPSPLPSPHFPPPSPLRFRGSHGGAVRRDIVGGAGSATEELRAGSRA